MELEVVALARPSRYESVMVWLARLSGKVTMTAAMPLFPSLALALYGSGKYDFFPANLHPRQRIAVVLALVNVGGKRR